MSSSEPPRKRRGARRLVAIAALAALGACVFAGSASAATVNVTEANSYGTTPQFTPQIVTAHPGDTIVWNSGSSSSPPTIEFVNPSTCAAANPPLSPFTAYSNGWPTTVSSSAADGTYYFYAPTSGACSPSLFSPSLAPYAGELVVSPAPSGSNASLTATVSVAGQFKSVTVSTNSETFANCSGGSSSGATLGFPNGNCSTPSFEVTNNGSVPESLDVQATNATPSDGGTPWSLITSEASPGQDQFRLSNQDAFLSTTPAPDTAAGTLQPNGVANESLTLTGPSASSDPSNTFSTAVTWTAF